MSQTGWTPVEQPTSAWTPVNTTPATDASNGRAGIITPREGESFEDTMKRAVQYGQGNPVTPEYMKQLHHDAIRQVPTVLGAAALAGPALMGGTVVGPSAASAATGGGVVGSAVGGGVGGFATEAINKLLKTAGGQNVLTSQTPIDLGKATATGAAAGTALGLLEKVGLGILGSKISRGAINESVGATARDVTYGNPAVGMLKYNVTAPNTGDLEAYKAALRSGANPDQALLSAGGRVSQVAQHVQELSPQLDKMLSQSNVPIKVADVIDKPLMDSATEIMNNPAMTDAEKDGAIAQIGALQKSLKEGLGTTVTPLQANQIKQAIGGRVNWGGNIAVTDEVKPAYRAVYGALKNGVNSAVPGSAQINEDLTNLLSAQTDLQKLMQSEEVGAGKGALGSAVTGVARRAEAVAGRAIPAANTAVKSAAAATPAASGPIGASIAEILRAKAAGQAPQ